MSEFSDALFLRDQTAERAIELLRSAKVQGYIFSAKNGWLPVAYSQGLRTGDTANFEALVDANPGVLIHYSYAEDHGCYVDIYERDVRVGRLKASFEGQNARFDQDEFVGYRLLTPADADTISAWVASAHDYKNRNEEDEYLVARLLHLPRYAWLSYHYELTTNAPDPERLEVDRDGQVLDVKGRPYVPGPEKRPAAKKTATKKTAAKKPLAKKPAAKKPTAKKKAGARSRNH